MKDIAMFPMNLQALFYPVTVEYDSHGDRVNKTLPDAYQARRFYGQMLRANRNPKVVGTRCTEITTLIQETTEMAKKKTTTAKKATTTTKKKTNAKKAPATKKALPNAVNENGLSAKGQSVIDYLAKAKATTIERAVDREKVLKACGITTATVSTLKDKGLMERVDLEDGVKQYKLTPAGSKLATK